MSVRNEHERTHVTITLTNGETIERYVNADHATLLESILATINEGGLMAFEGENDSLIVNFAHVRTMRVHRIPVIMR